MADTTNGGAPNIAEQYNLLPKLMPNLDRHLIYPLLNFSSDEEAEQPLSQKKLLLELLKPTNMTDFVGQLYQDIHDLDEMPDEFKKKRDQVLQRRDQLEEDTSKISGLLDDENVVTNLRSDKVQNLAYLKENHGVDVAMVNQLYEFGQFQYSCGVYPHAAELLYRFRVLSTDNDKVAEATWGKLASEILSVNWDSAMEEINKLKDSIETRLFANPLAQLQHRTWLIHWSLFPLFNHEPVRDQLTELFFSPNFINTIQTNCPWILRYLSAAVITSRNRGRNSNQYQRQLKDLIRIVRQEGYEYSDPVTDFIKALYIDFDFVEAQKKLSETEEILKNDFFLLGTADAFVDAARHLISESYCKIHQRIDIKDLSTRLGLSQDEGEKWIVNLIRDTRVDAKIDYQAGTVVMNHPPQSVYQQVIERTKGGFFRTQVLSAAVAK
ncbi:eukaryotic translation initiation factor-like protein 3 subunit E [Lindgomyces ingoldianus]|uniref:Eukaryotic translation initiation factor-like protein 3 subunit E n=1 Tax=Lindgomyces ingoldianus TaxID=673940 RepID=A0ACB6QTM3_9PLEO|nr:eukaryotic translation initiation factor-like protein 3 subunit E [Lindgomyces ingoldianus]KAF2470373.1 eukaryotic translation initiation factor-like protein 3 subunit E [Lindgomyces ingoldianus]